MWAWRPGVTVILRNRPPEEYQGLAGALPFLVQERYRGLMAGKDAFTKQAEALNGWFIQRRDGQRLDFWMEKENRSSGPRLRSEVSLMSRSRRQSETRHGSTSSKELSEKFDCPGQEDHTAMKDALWVPWRDTVVMARLSHPR